MPCDYSAATGDVVREFARVHVGAAEDYDPLMELIGNARVVLLGQASYGTHEFYAARARITQRLIEEKGFAAVAVETDWADTSRVNRYVRGDGEDGDALTALDGFLHFPTNTWRNAAVIDYLEWHRAYNQALQGDPMIGFFGLDLYNMHGSNRAVVACLDGADPGTARRMRCRYAYACFGDLSDKARADGDEAGLRLERSCEDEVIAELVEARRRSANQILSAGRVAECESFYAGLDALVANNAERYYRLMFGGKGSSWNLRNRHLAEVLAELVDHLEQSVARGKVVFWAHNAHVGDSRATEMQHRGEFSVGQLLRERYGPEAVLIGLTTYQGTVRAASEWGSPLQQRTVLSSLADSYETLFHEVGYPRFLLPIRGCAEATEALSSPRPQRSIGVIYRPEAEHLNHYRQARLSDQFDAVVHFDQTTAVQPLFGVPEYEAEEIPRTIPACA